MIFFNGYFIRYRKLHIKYGFWTHNALDWFDRCLSISKSDITINKIMQGYDEESADLAKIAIKRLNVVKEVMEHNQFYDNLDKDERKFAKWTCEWWQNMTDIQKKIVFMRIVQGFSFVGIAELQGKSVSTIKTNFYQACKKTRHFNP